MDIIDMARASGMAVLLDGKIGREEYQSVCGSLWALQRFADAVRQATADQNGNQKRHQHANGTTEGRIGVERRRAVAIDFDSAA